MRPGAAPAPATRKTCEVVDRNRRSTRRRRPDGYSMSSSSAAGRKSRARASFVMVRSRGSRPARSSNDTSVRCRSHASPRASCERPAASRAARRFVANWSTGSTIPDARRLRTKPLQTTHCTAASRELLSAFARERTRPRGPSMTPQLDRPPTTRMSARAEIPAPRSRANGTVCPECSVVVWLRGARLPGLSTTVRGARR